MKLGLIIIALFTTLSLTSYGQVQNANQISTVRMKNASNVTNPYKNDTTTGATILYFDVYEGRAGRIACNLSATRSADSLSGSATFWGLTAGGCWAMISTDSVSWSNVVTSTTQYKGWVTSADYSAYRVQVRVTSLNGGHTSFVVWSTWKLWWKP